MNPLHKEISNAHYNNDFSILVRFLKEPFLLLEILVKTPF